MYALEVSVGEEWEYYQFPTTEKVLDYVYMVEGESLLPEYRAEFQRNAPNTKNIQSLRNTSNFYVWRIGDGEGAITYFLSWMNVTVSPRNRRLYNFPKVSKFWGTVYGVDSRAEQLRTEYSEAG